MTQGDRYTIGGPLFSGLCSKPAGRHRRASKSKDGGRPPLDHLRTFNLLSQFDVMPVTAGRYVSGNIAVWRSGRGESYVNDMVGNRARVSGRYHCGLDRCTWIWTDAPD